MNQGPHLSRWEGCERERGKVREREREGEMGGEDEGARQRERAITHGTWRGGAVVVIRLFFTLTCKTVNGVIKLPRSAAEAIHLLVMH